LPERKREQAAPVRAFWSGTIAFGLVNIPVDLFAAVRTRRTSMKMVDRKGRPLGRQYYCPEDGKKLNAESIVRGYETEDGEMVVVTDEELEAIAPEMTRDIDLRRFVPLEQIPPTYYQRPYFLAPSGRSTKAYHLLAETMERTGRVGIGSFVMRGHEYLVAILSEGGLLRAETLRFADELRSPQDVGLPRSGKAPAKRVNELMRAIAELTRDALDMNELSDRYAGAIHELAEDKRRKERDVVEVSARAEDEDAETEGAEVIDLVKLLRERLSSKAKVSTAEHPGGWAKGSPHDLGKLSKQALYERAQALDIPKRSQMGKAELIKAIRKAG
jgi:DNA end-binding protein Ku